MRITPLDAWNASKCRFPAPVQPARLRAYQLSRLNVVLQHVRAHSRFYQRHLAGAPDTLQSLEEIARLPLTTADDLSLEGARMVCGSQDSVSRIVTLDTTGTTSAPKRVYFSPNDQELTIDFFHHGMSTFAAPGDRVAIFLPHVTPGSVGDLLAMGLQRHGVIPMRYGPITDPSAALAWMAAEGIHGAVGVPKHLLAVASLADATMLRGTLRWLLLSTDYLPRALSQRIEEAWHCRVFDHYGMTEMGLGGGVMCQAGEGYHLREADLYVEVIDPQSGEPLIAGEQGEVVFTTLTREAMPLIRYRTGDAGFFMTEPCPCGTLLRRLGQITHRIDGQVPLGGIPVTIAELDEVLFSLPGLIDFGALLSEEAPGRNLLKISPVHHNGQAADFSRIMRALSRLPAIAGALNSGALAITVEPVPFEAYRVGSMGKRRIIDNRRCNA